MKTVLKQGITFIFVFLLVGVLFNFALYGYYYLPAKIKVTGKSTRDIWQPNSRVVTAVEGFGYARVDERGYNNPPGLIESGPYYVVLGSSHTQGFNVKPNETYTSRMTSILHENGLDISVYNVGMDGHQFSNYVKHFKAALGQFPDAKGYIFETQFLERPQAEWIDALDMIEYSDSPVPEPGLKERIINFIQTLPICRLSYRQIVEMDMGLKNAFLVPSSKAEAEEPPDHSKEIMQAFLAVRALSDKPMIFMYHPQLIIHHDGTASAKMNENSLRSFKDACKAANIVFVNMAETYLSAYAGDATLPYGYANTTFATGHLNRDGHDMIAQVLSKIIMDMEDGAA